VSTVLYIIGCVLLGVSSFWIGRMAVTGRGKPLPWLAVFATGLLLALVC
jgi:hypothetical protein